MPKLKVIKGLRMPEDMQGASLQGAVYIEGDVVEPDAREAKFLLERFPEHFQIAPEPKL